MTHAVFPPSVMIVSAQLHRIEACNESGPPGKEPRSGFGAGPKAGLWAETGPCDPHQVQRLFPVQWQAYLRAHFRGIAQVVALFHVSERTARKWWNGEVDPAGHYVAIACRAHPETAPPDPFCRGVSAMAYPEWSDAEMLEALEMCRRGLSSTVIGAKLGRSRSAVCGLFHRIDRETDASDRGGVGNRTMPADWWRAGLARRAGA